MEETGKAKKVLGSESLGILLGRWRGGTFSEILTDWKWILSYTRRYRRAVWAYTVLGVISSTLGLVSAVASMGSAELMSVGAAVSSAWVLAA